MVLSFVKFVVLMVVPLLLVFLAVATSVMTNFVFLVLELRLLRLELTANVYVLAGSNPLNVK